MTHMRKTLFIFLVAMLLGACTSYNSDPLAPVEGYLVEKIGSTAFGGKVFCSYDILEAGVRIDGADIYVWALCGEYYLEDGMLNLGSASSLPVALYLESDARKGFTVTSHAVPLDGIEYMSSIRQIFPLQAIDKMCEEKPDCYNERANRLENSIEEKAREYYGLE